MNKKVACLVKSRTFSNNLLKLLLAVMRAIRKKKQNMKDLTTFSDANRSSIVM